jgi:TPR repeat protein
MSSIFHTAVLSVVVAVSGSMVAAQDLNKGLTAYQAGDYATALEEWRPLAEQGNVSAQFNLALMYDNGEGVLKDDTEAARWYRLAADQGYAKAQHNLGVMHDNGEGVVKDNREAARLFRLSAEQGYSAAQYNLGVKYSEGEGVLKDIITAHMWWNIASANGDDAAPSRRNQIETQMTREQIADATERARDCMASDYQDCD